MSFQRRKALRAAVQLAVASVFSGRIGRVSAGAEETQAAIDVFTDGVVPARGTVTLTLPEIAENGNTVSMSVSVESPMTEDSYVCLLYTSPSPRDQRGSRMPSSA